MGLNKKRIAERQAAAEKAKKQERNAKIGKWVAIGAAIAAGVALIALTVAMIVSATKTNTTTSTPSTNKPSGTPTTTAKPTEKEWEDIESKDYYAEIVIKDYGTIKLELDGDAAPATVNNFVKLAQEGFYNGLTFHRIIDGFMMQGGDPKGNGTGGSEEEIRGEFAENGWEHNDIPHERGVISMARAKDPDSASSQFFIVHQTSDNNSASLDGKYAAFGRVTEGMDVVDAVIAAAEPTDTNGSIAKDKQPVIESITVTEKQ